MTKVICDLDGVVYAGDTLLPGAAKALEALLGADVDVWFMTNNSTLSPTLVCSKIRQLTGLSVDPTRLVTSVSAAMDVVKLPVAGALVIGGQGITEGLAGIGVTTTDDPDLADLVMVGLDQGVTYWDIAAAAAAIRRGAQFIATNDDPTLPSPEGELPGAGSIVAAVSTAAGVQPIVAGKPHDPTVRRLLRSVGPEAWVIGDRVATDIAMARKVPGWRSILVLSGVTPPDHGGEADHVVGGLLEAANLVLASRDGQ